MPKISVIVPVYKVEAYLHRCVDSILAQTCTDFELILVDDGSPDNCGKICDEYAEKDQRIVVIHKENGGLSDARNAGIDWVFANSDSEWLTFIDSDDWIHRDYLKYLYKAAVDNIVDISMLQFEYKSAYCSDDPIEYSVALMLPAEAYFNHTDNVVSYAWGRLYRKDLFKDIRYPDGRVFEDIFTTYKLLFQCEKIAVLDAKMYYYFRNYDGITLSKWDKKKMTDEIEAHEASMAFLEKDYYSHYLIERKKFVKVLIRHYENLLKDGSLSLETVKVNKKILISKLKKSLLLLRRDNKKNFLADNATALEIVYPKTMWVYWTIKSILSKIKK